MLASAAGFGTLAILLKAAYAAGANTVTILAFRFLLAALLFWGIIWAKGIRLEIEKKVMWQILALGGIGYGAMSTLFANAVQVLPASLAAMLLYTYPAQVAILAVLVGDERFGWKKAGALAICLAGLALILDASFAQVSTVGFALGIASATVYSLYIIMGNRLMKKADALVTTTLVCSAAAVIFLIYGGVNGQLIISLPAGGWGAIAGISVFATVIAILFFFAGMKEVGASNASIISTVEPVITVLLSWLVLGETVGLLQLMGGALILSGVVLLQLIVEKEPLQVAE